MQLPTYTKIFLEYYEQQFWTNRSGSSGPNSDFARTTALQQAINALLDRYEIISIVDAGCGDANLIRGLSLAQRVYLGLDCVPAMIQMNQAVFSEYDHWFFEVADVVADPLPQADLVISRDVLHYLPNALINTFLDNVRASGSRYLLVTHNTMAPQSANVETDVGIFRPVNLSQAPFDWPEPVEVLQDTDIGKCMALFQMT